MLIGTKEYDYGRITRCVGSPINVVNYAEELVPVWLRHIPQINDNQRYYLAIQIRNMLSIPFKQRVELCEALLKGIHVTGTINKFTDFNELLDVIDVQSLIKVLEEV